MKHTWGEELLYPIPNGNERVVGAHVYRVLQAYLKEHVQPQGKDYKWTSLNTDTFGTGTVVECHALIPIPVIRSDTPASSSSSTLAQAFFKAEVRPLPRKGVEVGISFTDGDLLSSMAEHLLEALQRQWPPTAASDHEDIPSWVPGSERTRRKWRRAYRVVDETRQEALDPLDPDARHTPTLDEYRERLIDKMKWSVSTKTIGRIVEAGDEGWIAAKPPK